jgi:hypothetical protein
LAKINCSQYLKISSDDLLTLSAVIKENISRLCRDGEINNYKANELCAEDIEFIKNNKNKSETNSQYAIVIFATESKEYAKNFTEGEKESAESKKEWISEGKIKNILETIFDINKEFLGRIKSNYYTSTEDSKGAILANIIKKHQHIPRQYKLEESGGNDLKLSDEDKEFTVLNISEHFTALAVGIDPNGNLKLNKSQQENSFKSHSLHADGKTCGSATALDIFAMANGLKSSNTFDNSKLQEIHKIAVRQNKNEKLTKDDNTKIAELKNYAVDWVTREKDRQRSR